MTVEYTPLVLDSQFLADNKKIVRERIIPWEGLARASVITEDEANHIKILEKQSIDNRNSTILSQLKLYSNTLLNLLNKLEVDSRDDVLKNLLVLINDLLVGLPEQQFLAQLIELTQVDAALPFEPFVKHLADRDPIIKAFALYNLTILLVKAAKSGVKVDSEVLIRVYETLSGPDFIGHKDVNYQFVGVQLLQDLVIEKSFKSIYGQHNLLGNFKPINHLINHAVASNSILNSANLQLIYNVLLDVWILSFNAKINKAVVHNYPELISNLLIVAKDSIKLKIIRLAVTILKNYTTIIDNNSESERFKIIKLILYSDGLSTIKNLRERKFSSNGSDEELSTDLNDLYDSLNDVVQNKLSSFDEYSTQLENPNLLSWSSPTHKSNEFWLENSRLFKENNFKLVKKVFEILGNKQYDKIVRIILLNDIQFLIKNLGQQLVDFINSENGGAYKLLVMTLLDDNEGDNELKYQALKTIQLLVGHSF